MMRISRNIWLLSSCKISTEVSSWWLDSGKQPVLIDCPEVDQTLVHKLLELAAGRSPLIVLTSRDSHNNFKKLREYLNWDALIQEQEAYLLPGLSGLESFSEEFNTYSGLKLLWTPGATPGSCIVYAPLPWNVVFCGRLLIPVANNRLVGLRTKKTFHWTMQKKSLQKFRDWIPLEARPSLASGGNLNVLGSTKLLPWEAWGKGQNIDVIE